MKKNLFLLVLLMYSFLSAQQAYLGIFVSPPSNSELRSAKLSYGLKIDSVMPGSPAEEFGLMKNDIIFKIDNDIIRNMSDLSKILAKTKPNEKIAVHFASNNKQFAKNITLSNRDVLYKELYLYNYIQNPWLFIGIQVESISSSLASLLNLEKGMVILNVREKSIASTQGLEPGDIIISINKNLTTNEQNLTEALNKGLQNQPMNFLIWRNNANVILKVDLSNSLNQASNSNEIFIIGPDVFDSELFSYSKDKINNLLNKSKTELEIDIDRLEQEIFQLRQLIEKR